MLMGTEGMAADPGAPLEFHVTAWPLVPAAELTALPFM
jgi:hypothetical protein